jgi:hypothetical protein
LIQHIRTGDQLLAIIIGDDFHEEGVHFVTPFNLSQQLAFIRHPSGKKIAPHLHNSLPREVLYTQEVLILKKGRVRVDFYDECQVYLESRVIKGGDVILLVSGGHGFEVLDEVEMIEVKQGPFAGESDKTRFSPAGREDGEGSDTSQ